MPEPCGAGCPDEIDDLRLHGHIECRVGSSRMSRRGRRAHGHRDHHTLAHAPRELMRIRMEHPLRIADAELAEQIRHAAP
jgi:hypothetical protein